MTVEFGEYVDGRRASACGRYVIVRGFSQAIGSTVYRAWRKLDETSYDRPLGEYFREQYAEDACKVDAGVR